MCFERKAHYKLVSQILPKNISDQLKSNKNENKLKYMKNSSNFPFLYFHHLRKSFVEPCTNNQKNQSFGVKFYDYIKQNRSKDFTRNSDDFPFPEFSESVFKFQTSGLSNSFINKPIFSNEKLNIGHKKSINILFKVKPKLQKNWSLFMKIKTNLRRLSNRNNWKSDIFSVENKLLNNLSHSHNPPNLIGTKNSFIKMNSKFHN